MKMSHDAWQKYSKIKKPTLEDLEEVVRDMSVMVATSMELANMALEEAATRKSSRKKSKYRFFRRKSQRRK